MRTPDPRETLAEALKDLLSAADENKNLWSAAVNAHWLAIHLGQPETARRVLEAARRNPSECPFAAAYFARVLNESGDAEGALALVEHSAPAPDAHMRTELALATIQARVLKRDLAALMAAYAGRIRASDGDRDRQHVVIHFLHALECLWDAGTPGFDSRLVSTAAEGIAAAEPDEVGHWWTLWGILSAAGRRRDTIDALLRGAGRFPDNASHVEFLVSCAWRVLDSSEGAKPN